MTRLRSPATISAQALLAFTLAAGASACEPDHDGTNPPSLRSAAPRVAHKAKPRKIKKTRRPKAPAAAPDAGVAPSVPDNPDAGASAGWKLDELTDVAPAGPATATAAGVLMVTRTNQIAIATLGALKPGPPRKTPIRALTLEPEVLVALRKGPAVLGGFAYWISERRLVRLRFDGEREAELEILASDARPSTRVAAPSHAADEPGCVAYIAEVPGTPAHLEAKLWVEGHGVIPLTAEGSTASSVAFSRNQAGLSVLSLEGRTGMTPLHVRSVELGEGKPRLGEDVVAWVGGPAQPMTEIMTIGWDGELFAFVALGRGVRDFGLARINLGSKPKMDSPVNWTDYANGLDPAPIATASVCGEPALLFVQPETARPGSPQALRLTTVRGGSPGPGRVVARSRAFANISMLGVTGGGLIAYTADRRTWARTIRCD